MATSINVVNVRWFDGYLETFNASEVRFGSDLLWMRLVDGPNRQIPLRHVRWFSTSQESHGTDTTLATTNGPAMVLLPSDDLTPERIAEFKAVLHEGQVAGQAGCICDGSGRTCPRDGAVI
jgi:hypothetical protein